MFDVFLCGTFVYPPLICPPLPPRPFTPAGVKGSLNSRFGFLALDTGFGSGVCDARLDAYIDKRDSRSEWIANWGTSSNTLFLGASRTQAINRLQRKFSARKLPRVCNVSAGERAHASPSPLGRAEQRSGARIRAGACLSVASLRPTPGGASSARQPAGPRPLARLSFAYFSLAKQRKVRPAAGSKPASRPKPEPRNIKQN